MNINNNIKKNDLRYQKNARTKNTYIISMYLLIRIWYVISDSEWSEMNALTLQYCLCVFFSLSVPIMQDK